MDKKGLARRLREYYIVDNYRAETDQNPERQAQVISEAFRFMFKEFDSLGVGVFPAHSQKDRSGWGRLKLGTHCWSLTFETLYRNFLDELGELPVAAELSEIEDLLTKHQTIYNEKFLDKREQEVKSK